MQLIEVPGVPGSAEALELEVLALQYYGEYGPCPGSPPAPAVPSPGAVALQLWRDQVQLAQPGVEIPPGKAIVGKAAFLQIGGPREQAWYFDALGYGIDITATSTYDVDWGDGTVDTGLTSQGGPWPDGDINHTYQRSGAYDVVVTQRWTATWTAVGPTGPAGGTIEGVLETQQVLADFPVEQIQAVRDR